MERTRYYIQRIKSSSNKQVQLLGKLLEDELKEFIKQRQKIGFIEYLGKRLTNLQINRKYKDLKNKRLGKEKRIRYVRGYSILYLINKLFNNKFYNIIELLKNKKVLIKVYDKSSQFVEFKEYNNCNRISKEKSEIILNLLVLRYSLSFIPEHEFNNVEELKKHFYSIDIYKLNKKEYSQQLISQIFERLEILKNEELLFFDIIENTKEYINIAIFLRHCQFKNSIIGKKLWKTFLELNNLIVHKTLSPLHRKDIQEKRDKTLKEKYGVSSIAEYNKKNINNVREKIKETNLQKYGVSSILKLKEIRGKGKQKFIEKYGIDNPAKLEFVKEKNRQQMKDTNHKKKLLLGYLEKYKHILDNQEQYLDYKQKILNGEITNVSQIKEIFEKVNVVKSIAVKRGLNIEDVENKLLNPEFWKNKGIKEILTELNISSLDYYRYRKKLNLVNKYDKFNNIRTNKSNFEDILEEYIKSFGFKVERNVRFYDDKLSKRNLEFDLYVPELNLFIEISGILFHSIGVEPIYNLDNFELLKNRSFNKANFVQKIKKGQYLEIYDFELFNPIKSKIIFDILNYKLKLKNEFKLVNARDLELVILTKSEIDKNLKQKIRDFLIHNHIQGYPEYSKNDIVILAIEPKSQEIYGILQSSINKSTKTLKIDRIATKVNHIVRGLKSRMFKHLIDTILKYDIFRTNIEYIITFTNRRFFSGNFEYKFFDEIEITKPNYFYYDWKNKKLVSRIQYQKHKVLEILKNKYGYNPEQIEKLKNLTEFDLTLNHLGLRVLFDAGNVKFTKRVNS